MQPSNGGIPPPRLDGARPTAKNEHIGALSMAAANAAAREFAHAEIGGKEAAGDACEHRDRQPPILHYVCADGDGGELRGGSPTRRRSCHGCERHLHTPIMACRLENGDRARPEGRNVRVRPRFHRGLHSQVPSNHGSQSPNKISPSAVSSEKSHVAFASGVKSLTTGLWSRSAIRESSAL